MKNNAREIQDQRTEVENEDENRSLRSLDPVREVLGSCDTDVPPPAAWIKNVAISDATKTFVIRCGDTRRYCPEPKCADRRPKSTYVAAMNPHGCEQPRSPVRWM